jgi:hypothetical protein
MIDIDLEEENMPLRMRVHDREPPFEATMGRPKRKTKTRRGFPRRSACAEVRVTYHRKTATDVPADGSVVVLDLSEAGARLLITAALKVDEEVVLRLHRPSSRPLTRQGKVVWSFRVTKWRYAVGVRLEEHIGTDEIHQVTIQSSYG